MREWLTAREIAEARLPGLPQSKRKVNALAAREGWTAAKSDAGEALARKRPGRDGGGGVEFHVSLLPSLARTRLEARAGKTRPEPVLAHDAGELKPRDVSRRDARLFVVARSDDFHRAHADLSRRQSDEAYSVLYNHGAGEVPAWVRSFVKRLSRPSIERWRSARRNQRLDLVAGRYSNREGARQIETLKDGEIVTFIGALLIKQPFLTAPHIRAIVEGRYGQELQDLPSPRTFQRFVADWKRDNRLVLRKLTDPDGYKSHARLSGNNSNAHVRALNQLWEIDASPADVLTTDGRHAVYVVVDIWSRRMMVLVTKTPRTEATLALIRRAILAWGVPETIKTDNGSDFTSQRFVSAMNSLGIAHETSDAFSPEQKGTVERTIGTLQRGLMPLLPGFVGHSVADRKVIEQRKAFAARLGESDEHTFCVEITASELQTYCDEYADNVYAHAAHKGLDGKTPFARAASWMGGIRRIENERALDLLLMPLGWRTATKQGIALDRGQYISPDLMPGTRYLCRQDPEDMGRLYVFEDEHGAFITTAICPERAGIDPREAIKAARERQAEIIAEKARAVRQAARKIKPRDMVDWLQDGARRKVKNLTAFPQRADLHTSAALSAAADATSGDPLPVVTAEAMPSLAAATNVVQLPETPKQMFRRAIALRDALAAGETIGDDDARWLGSYENSDRFKSLLLMYEDHGREWLEA